jgi:dTDP-4-amino-4,6-dideoxygalactose transaminase
LRVRAESFDAIPADRVLCLVAAHLFGFLDDGEMFRKAARKTGAFVMDDAAQALGGQRDGVPAGMAGDVGIYSLGRGKALPLGEGGVVVSNNPVISDALQSEMDNLPHAETSPVSGGLKLAATSVLLNPQLYWMPNALPFLKLGITEYDPSFPIARLSRLTAAMLEETVGWVATLNRVRTDNACEITAALAGVSSFTVLRPPSGCDSTYIRLPVLAASRHLRDRGVAALRAAGIGATAMYPGALCDLEALKPHLLGSHCAGAEEVAARLLTLPTNPLLCKRDIAAIANTLGSVRV